MVYYHPYPDSKIPAEPPEPPCPALLPEEQLERLERRIELATPGTWELQTSNSWRRIGTAGVDGNVMQATRSLNDGIIDLGGPYANLEYMIESQPEVVRALIDEVRYHRAVALQRQQQADLNASMINNEAIGQFLDGVADPFAGAILLFETIAECGATSFINGQATPMRTTCLDFAAKLRAAVGAKPAPSTVAIQSTAAQGLESEKPTVDGCSRCGSRGLHACTGEPLEPITPQKARELDAILDRFEDEMEKDRLADRAVDSQATLGVPVRIERQRAVDMLLKTAAWVRSSIALAEPGAQVALFSIRAAINKIEGARDAAVAADDRVGLFGDVELAIRWLEQLPVPPIGVNARLQVLQFLLSWVRGGMQKPGDAFGGFAEWPASEVFGALIERKETEC